MWAIPLKNGLQLIPRKILIHILYGVSSNTLLSPGILWRQGIMSIIKVHICNQVSLLSLNEISQLIILYTYPNGAHLGPQIEQMKIKFMPKNTCKLYFILRLTQYVTKNDMRCYQRFLGFLPFNRKVFKSLYRGLSDE